LERYKLDYRIEKGKAMEVHIVVRRRGSRIFLDNRLIDGGEAVSLRRRPPFASKRNISPVL
jgi:hypothetical protein